MKKAKTCCFFGHRKVPNSEALRKKLHNIVEELIVSEGYDTFLFVSKSEFNSLCREVLSELKERHPHIKRVYVRAEYPEINDDYKAYLLQSYEETYYTPRAINAGRAAYVERNYEMIDKSDLCVVCYNESYSPPEKKNTSPHLPLSEVRSGTRIAYNYAIQKKKRIINVFK